MSYTIPMGLEFGSRYGAGTVLECDVLDINSILLSTITTGFTHLGNGNWSFVITLSDGFEGFLRFRSLGPIINISIDIVPISPSYAENLDVKVSSISGSVSATLSQAERDAIATTILDLQDSIETGINLRKAMRANLAAIAGVMLGAEGSNRYFFRGGDSTPQGPVQGPRLTAKVDNKGNRLVIVMDLN